MRLPEGEGLLLLQALGLWEEESQPEALAVVLALGQRVEVGQGQGEGLGLALVLVLSDTLGLSEDVAQGEGEREGAVEAVAMGLPPLEVVPERLPRRVLLPVTVSVVLWLLDAQAVREWVREREGVPLLL